MSKRHLHAPAFPAWERATGVVEAAMPGLIAQRHLRRLTWALALLLSVLLWPALGFGGVLVALVFARLVALDLTTYTLPNIYTVPLMAVGLMVAWGEHLAVTLMVWLALLLLGGIGRYWQNSKVVLGEGDLKLLAALVACLGPLPSLAAIGMGCLFWFPGAAIMPQRPLPLGVPLLLGWAAVLAFPGLPDALFSPISV